MRDREWGLTSNADCHPHKGHFSQGASSMHSTSRTMSDAEFLIVIIISPSGKQFLRANVVIKNIEAASSHQIPSSLALEMRAMRLPRLSMAFFTHYIVVASLACISDVHYIHPKRIHLSLRPQPSSFHSSHSDEAARRETAVRDILCRKMSQDSFIPL